jgi:hypothetical protein
VVEGVLMPRVDASLAAVQGGKFIAVAGGSNGTALQDEVDFFQYVGLAFTKVTTTAPPRLREPRCSIRRPPVSDQLSSQQIRVRLAGRGLRAIPQTGCHLCDMARAPCRPNLAS